MKGKGNVEKFFEAVGKTVLISLGLLYCIALNGFVVLKLWFWFAVPIFGANPLTFMQCVGLTCFMAYLRFRQPTQEEQNTKFTSKVVFQTLVAGEVLLAGWIISHFI